MVQHSVKKKVKLPEGVKKSKNAGGGRVAKKATGPKRGQHLHIAPKNQQKIKQLKMERDITKAINAENEELIRQQAASGVAGTSSSRK